MCGDCHELNVNPGTLEATAGRCYKEQLSPVISPLFHVAFGQFYTEFQNRCQ